MTHNKIILHDGDVSYQGWLTLDVESIEELSKAHTQWVLFRDFGYDAG
jgi:hypothetical protein